MEVVFDISLKQIENYNSLMEKLQNNATVIYAFNKSNLGYFANDFVNKLAYITLYQSNYIGTALLTKCSDFEFANYTNRNSRYMVKML